MTYFGGDASAGLPEDTETKNYWLKYFPADHVMGYVFLIILKLFELFEDKYLFIYFISFIFVIFHLLALKLRIICLNIFLLITLWGDYHSYQSVFILHCLSLSSF